MRQSIRLVKKKDFCEAITLTYFVENCFELPQRYSRHEAISKALVFYFPKINQFTCDKMFITFAQMSIYP